MGSQTNGNSVYMDSIVQVQSNGNNTWYDYGNTFSNIMITSQGDQQLTFDEVTIDQTQRAKLIRNTKRSSTMDRSYYCNECGANFSNSSNLKSHSRIHSGERPYVCDVCGASFVQSSNMKVHKRIHTGERPYTCSECGQTFSRSSHLTGHKRTHTGERPYICGICRESFVTSTHLRNHMRKHTGEKPFVCKTCESSFSQKGSLQIHQRIHTGERPFKCGNCTSAFRSKGDLHSHHKLHTEFRPFLCEQCNKTFKTKQYLQKHMKKCGTPPTGKKRGRPKMLNTSEITIAKDNEKVNNTKDRRSRLRVKELFKLTDNEQELDTEDILIDPLKINEQDFSHIIEESDNDQHSFFITGVKSPSNDFSDHSQSSLSQLNNLSNCSNELPSSTLVTHAVTTEISSIF